MIRAARRVVDLVDDVVNVALGTMEEIGTHRGERPTSDPLAGFCRASRVGAKGAKWSIVGVIGVGVLLMVGAAVLLPRSKPLPSPRPMMAPPSPAPAASAAITGNRAVIAARCKAGETRAFPEIEEAECAGRPAISPAHTGGMK